MWGGPSHVLCTAQHGTAYHSTARHRSSSTPRLACALPTCRPRTGRAWPGGAPREIRALHGSRADPGVRLSKVSPDAVKSGHTPGYPFCYDRMRWPQGLCGARIQRRDSGPPVIKTPYRVLHTKGYLAASPPADLLADTPPRAAEGRRSASAAGGTVTTRAEPKPRCVSSGRVPFARKFLRGPPQRRGTNGPRADAAARSTPAVATHARSACRGP